MSVFEGVDSYIDKAYIKQMKDKPKIKGCSINNYLTRNLKLTSHHSMQIHFDSVYG